EGPSLCPALADRARPRCVHRSAPASVRERIHPEERVEDGVLGDGLETKRSQRSLMDLGLTDKVALVTGSSRGLGLAIARGLVTEGCRVTICARGAERLAEAALEVEAAAKRPNMIATVQADVSTAAGVELAIARAVDAFGGLDILVNNVGRAAGTDLLGTSD